MNKKDSYEVEPFLCLSALQVPLRSCLCPGWAGVGEKTQPSGKR